MNKQTIFYSYGCIERTRHEGHKLELSVDRYLVTLSVNLHLKFARVGDGDILERTVTGAFGKIFDGEDDIHTLNNVAEDDVLVVQPAGENGADELLKSNILVTDTSVRREDPYELGAVGVLAGVSH